MTRVLRAIATLLLVGSASAADAATASWNANPEPDIAGYILSYKASTTGVCVGDVPVASAVSLNVGNVTTVLVALTPGVQYFFVIQAYNTSGLISPCSAEFPFTVDAGAPTFLTQPINQTIDVLANAIFTVAATGTPAPALQWQISTNNGVTWTNLTNAAPYSGVTTTTLTVTSATGGLSGARYRAVASSTAGNVPSNAAILTVNIPVAPAITTHPGNQTVTAGQNTSFTVAASGTTPTFQWQISTNGGATFTNLANSAVYSGVTSVTLALTGVPASLNAARYRAVASNASGTATSNAATLTVNTLPAFTTQPASQTSTVGQDVLFAVVATGNPAPTYQWQLSTNSGASWSNLSNGAPYSGVTTATLTVNVQAGLAGNQYRAVATNSVGFTTSNAATLTINFAPAITTQPANQTVTVAQNGSFTVAASGTPTPTFQWQVSSDNGASFTNLTNAAPYSGVTTATLTITAVTAGINSFQYRAVATNTAGNATSNAATLTVDLSEAPAITTQPTDQVVTIGQNVSFTVAASGIPAPTFQWGVCTSGASCDGVAGGPFTDLANAAPYSGVTTATLTITGAAAGLSGARYRAVATNGVGSPATSNAAILTVNIGAPIITAQPTNQSVTAGQTAQFTVAAAGTPAPTYQWQISTNGGGTFSNLANTAPYSGVTTTTLTVSGVIAALDGALYRAAATNGFGVATSVAALLTVNVAPTITTQPTGQTVTAGQNGSFTVVAGGSPAPTFQWQVSTNGGATFTNLTNVAPYSGVTTATLTLTNITAPFNGYQYRAVATNIAGSAASNAGALSVTAPPTITAQPADQTIAEGQNAQFTVAAGGNPSPALQWQVSTNAGVDWTDLTNTSPYSGVTTTTLTLTGATAVLNGNQYRAVAANSAGTTPSNGVTLTVITPPTIATQPLDVAVIAGQLAAFTVVASGTPTPTYQWQASTDFGLTWTNITGASATTATFSLTATTWWRNAQFRCVVTNAGGTTTSSAAILTVYGAMTVSPASVVFSASKTAGSATLSNLTPAQSTMTVGFTGSAATWTATANDVWLQVTNGTGTGGGQFTVEVVNPGDVIGANTVMNGSVTVTASTSSNWPVVVPVTLLITQTLTALPVGSFDAPGTGASLQGSVALGGWALAPASSDEIDRVEIWRDVVAGDQTAPFQGSGPANGKIFVANAPLVDGARPDVEAQFASAPEGARAAWGTLVLTRGLSSQGDGSYTLYAIAYDTAGRSALVGTTTITVDNANAFQPFGTIDSPAEGATVSGTISVTGWALTPSTACTISPTGVFASIDSGPLLPVLYGQARPDIASVFPGFTNSDAAGGTFNLDTTSLLDGRHQISWSVGDSCGQHAWIGTRLFTVLNGTNAPAVGSAPVTAMIPSAAALNWDPVVVNWGPGAWSLAHPNADGVRIVQIADRNRIDVDLPALGGATYTGFSSVGGQARALPLGSSLAGQDFSWEPAAGFLGSYELVFVATLPDSSVQIVHVRIVVGPAMRLWIETPPEGADVAQPFELTGWALDLAAESGTGIETVQVRAVPPGGLVAFVGTAATGEAWPIVAAMHGAQFTNAGFRISISGLAPGTYDLIVSAYMTPYGPLRATRTVRVTVH